MNRESERKRLVELLTEGQPPFNPLNWVCIEKLADHLLDNGIVVPPVKTGQKVYIITEVSKTIRETEVIGIWHGEHEYSIITRIGTIHRNAIGETVFPTREQAEQALKGGEDK